MGDADPVVAVEDAAAWCDHTRGEGEVRVLPGGHFFIDQRVREVAEIVRGALSSTAAAPRSGSCRRSTWECSIASPAGCRSGKR
ncbi:hypothetical protein NKH18_29390 [Streptomyces sp. M10(2022)]